MNGGVERLRLFVAFDLPRAVLEDLEARSAAVRERVEGARWTPIENRHVTLKFLGSVERPRYDAVVAAVGAAAAGARAGEVRVVDLGAFPSARRARVLWAGIEDPANLLSRLAASLDAVFEPLGFEPEKRGFTPHLTLARLKVPADVRDAVTSVSYRSEPVAVDSIHLFRSHLSPRGARYEIRETFVLPR